MVVRGRCFAPSPLLREEGPLPPRRLRTLFLCPNGEIMSVTPILQVLRLKTPEKGYGGRPNSEKPPARKGQGA